MQPPLPQFGLRSLLLMMSALSVLFALMTTVVGRWAIVLAWFVVLAAAHVWANAWGTRTRRNLPPTFDKGDEADRRPRRGAPPDAAFAPVTRLGRHSSIGRVMLFTTSAGAVVGAGVGSWLLWEGHPGPVGWVGLIVGGVSSSAVGGLLGFLTSSFLNVALLAIGEASRDH